MVRHVLTSSLLALLVITLSLVVSTHQQEQCTSDTCCPSNEFQPCAPSGALSPDDAQYRFLGAVSGLPGSSLPTDVADDLDVLSSDDSTFSRLSFEVRFLRNMASECRIFSEWDVTSLTESEPQCSLEGACSSTYADCAGVSPAETSIDLRIGNIRWSQTIGTSMGTMPFEEMQFYRKKRYSAANDDAEDNKQSSLCSGNNDDLDCQCCDTDDYSTCDDNLNNSSQCPTLCDVGNCDSDVSKSTADCAPNGKVGTKTYMYAWGHRYTTGASTDYTCSDGNDEEDSSPCSSSNAALCDRSLHPTTAFGGGAFGALPVQMVDAYALGLVYDGCQLSNACLFDGDVPNWSKKPKSFSDDVDDMNTCTASTDIIQKVDINALPGLVNYQIRTDTYRQMVSDVDNDNNGAYTKITQSGVDHVTSLTCGYCNPDGSDSNLSANRYFQYAMTPTCTIYQMSDPSSIIPVWDGSFTVTAGGLVAMAGPAMELGASTSLVTSSTAQDMSVKITLDEAIVLSPPAIDSTSSEYLVTCIPDGLEGEVLASDIDYNFPYLNGDRFPDGPCLGCMPLQQAGLDSQRLWYPMSFGSYAGLTQSCKAGSNPSSSFMSGGMTNINGQTHSDPNTNPESVAEYGVCADTSERNCRPLNVYEDIVAGSSYYGPGFTASPLYVSSRFEKFHDEYDAWIAAGSVPADEPQVADSEAQYFLLDQHLNQDGAPLFWIYLGDRYPGPGLMFVERDDDIDSSGSGGDTDRPSFRVDLYIRDGLASAGAQYVPATLDMQATSLANLCPALNPLDFCDPDALSQSTTVDTDILLQTCGYTVVGIQFSFTATTGAVTVRLNLDACEAQGYRPFCLATDTDCQSITSVNGVTITDAAQTNFANVDLFFGATAAATCNSPCEGVVEQCLTPDTSGPAPCSEEEGHATTDVRRVESCADTSGSVLGPVPGQGNFEGDVFCARSATPAPSITPSPTATPSITPSIGSAPSTSNSRTPAGPTASTSRSNTASPSTIITVTATTTAYYDPYYDNGDPDACGWFCDLACVCADDISTAQCLLAPCLLLVYLGVVLGFISLIACIFCCVRRKKKKDAEDANDTGDVVVSM